MQRRRLLAALALAALWPEVAQAAGAQPQLLEFWASWCPVCRHMEPTMAALKQRWGKQVAVRIVDVDDPANAALLRQYRVVGTATFVLLDGQGKEVFRDSGEIPQAVLEAQFKKVLQSS